MKLITYARNGLTHLGALFGESVAEFDSPATMRELISAEPAVLSSLVSAISAGKLRTYPMADVHLLAPLPNPSKIVGIGLNYLDHCKEAKLPVPARPLVFA